MKRKILCLALLLLSCCVFAKDYIVGDWSLFGRITEITAIPEREGYYKLTFECDETIYTFVTKKGNVIMCRNASDHFTYSYRIDNITDNAVSMTTL